MGGRSFKGKSYVYSHHLSVPFRDLKIDKEKSKPVKSGKPNMDDNLIIQGDNLHALKALLPRYAGKIKCIYIDPPYNTGNEGWCYNDKVNSPLMREWLEDNANPVDRDDLERHDKWLCMMWPRLQLLRELLADDGVIFISVDDNEVQNLKCLLDEVWGDKNWLGTIVWKNVTDNNPTNIAVEHEYIVCYAKNKDKIESEWKSPLSAVKDKLINIGDKLNNQYDDASELQKAYSQWFKENKQYLWPLDRYKYLDKGGVYTGSQSVHNPGKEGYRYDILHPITGKPCKEPLMGYRFPEDTAKRLIDEGKFLFGDDENKIIELKVYAHEYVNKLPSVINLDGRLGAYELRSIFQEVKKAFDTPKTTQLIEQLISFVTKSGDIVLDSFAGSGTTAHAVLAINKEDGGNRKFILVEMEDYANDITAERVRRVIDGVPNTKDENLREGLGGSFTYCDLGEAFDIDKILTGENLPSYTALASYVFYTVTGQSLEKDAKQNANFFIGETDLFEVYLIYKDDLAYLRHNDSALNQDKMDIIAAHNPKSTKQKIVFATAKYMSQDALKTHNIVFCQIPYAIHKIAGN
jgi:adenine-specific DNA-methyltransferase